MKKLGVEDYKEALIAETLAKSLAYTEGTDGAEIQIPVKQEDGKYALVTYTIEKIALGDKLPCYILTSESGPPWVVPRGTEVVAAREGALESVIADAIDPNGIAQHTVIKAMVQHQGKDNRTLIDRFNSWKDNEVLIAGHSLGGYLTNDIAIRFRSKVKTAYGFSAPTVGKELGEVCQKAVENREMRYNQIINFDVEGDPVASAGVGIGLVGLRLAIKPFLKPEHDDGIHNHLRHNLNGNFTVQAVDVAKEKTKLARRLGLSENARVLAGKILGLVLKKESLPDWWTKRQDYDEKLAPHQISIVPTKKA